MSEKIKRRIRLFFPFVVLLLGIMTSTVLLVRTYQQIAFKHISSFCEIALENSPEIQPQLLSTLKEYHTLTEEEISESAFLEKYGYRVDEFCQGVPYYTIIVIQVIVFILTTGVFVCRDVLYRKWKYKRIDELTEYLEQVNTGGSGTLIQTQEDDYSHLQDQIYKTVTALNQTRENAVRSKKKFAENLANIAHQLKTPITAAVLSLQFMKRNVPEMHVMQLEKQLNRLNQLEECLLTLSRIDAGALPLNNSKVDIFTALNLAADNLNDLLWKYNVSIEIPDKGCIEFWGDMEWTMEALMNLMKNCMEHSQPGGTVHCDYTENPLYKEIRIWDTGSGFDTEDIPHLFERFYRGKRAVGNGIGIGLSLAQSIIELQNGTISAYNQQNGGACFEIRVYSH